jgi:hypothetical protein
MLRAACLHRAMPFRKMMSDSADAWNRGGRPAFASYYEDSPQTNFMGREIVRVGGRPEVSLDRGDKQ